MNSPEARSAACASCGAAVNVPASAAWPERCPKCGVAPFSTSSGAPLGSGMGGGDSGSLAVPRPSSAAQDRAEGAQRLAEGEQAARGAAEPPRENLARSTGGSSPDAGSAAQDRGWPGCEPPFVSIAVMPPPIRLIRWLYRRLGGEIRGGYLYSEKGDLS